MLKQAHERMDSADVQTAVVRQIRENFHYDRIGFHNFHIRQSCRMKASTSEFNNVLWHASHVEACGGPLLHGRRIVARLPQLCDRGT